MKLIKTIIYHKLEGLVNGEQGMGWKKKVKKSNMLPRDDINTRTELEYDTGRVGPRNNKQSNQDHAVKGCAPGSADDASKEPDSKTVHLSRCCKLNGGPGAF